MIWVLGFSIILNILLFRSLILIRAVFLPRVAAAEEAMRQRDEHMRQHDEKLFFEMEQFIREQTAKLPEGPMKDLLKKLNTFPLIEEDPNA